MMPAERAEPAEARVVDGAGRPEIIDEGWQPAAPFEPTDIPGADHSLPVRTPRELLPDKPVPRLVREDDAIVELGDGNR